eukprot:1193739-Prorocentrum_minimum.AAC.1
MLYNQQCIHGLRGQGRVSARMCVCSLSTKGGSAFMCKYCTLYGANTGPPSTRAVAKDAGRCPRCAPICDKRVEVAQKRLSGCKSGACATPRVFKSVQECSRVSKSVQECPRVFKGVRKLRQRAPSGKGAAHEDAPERP